MTLEELTELMTDAYLKDALVLDFTELDSSVNIYPQEDGTYAKDTTTVFRIVIKEHEIH